MNRFQIILQSTVLVCAIIALVGVAMFQPAEPIERIQTADLCISSNSSCNTSNGISLVSYEHKPHTTKQLPPKQAPHQLACTIDPERTAAYEQQLSAALSAANAQVDAVRAQAISNGESYQTFDAQLNSLFAAYDVTVQGYYAAYMSHAHSCTPQLAPPQQFQMFTP